MAGKLAFRIQLTVKLLLWGALHHLSSWQVCADSRLSRLSRAAIPQDGQRTFDSRHPREHRRRAARPSQHLPYTVYCTLFTVHCLVYTVYCTLPTVHCLLYTVYCTLPVHLWPDPVPSSAFACVASSLLVLYIYVPRPASSGASLSFGCRAWSLSRRKSAGPCGASTARYLDALWPPSASPLYDGRSRDY